MFWSFWPQGRWDLNQRITKKVPVVVSLLQRFTLFKKILVCSLVWKHQELSDVKKSQRDRNYHMESLSAAVTWTKESSITVLPAPRWTVLELLLILGSTLLGRLLGKADLQEKSGGEPAQWKARQGYQKCQKPDLANFVGPSSKSFSFKKYLFILSCVGSQLWHAESLLRLSNCGSQAPECEGSVLACGLSYSEVCGILVP